MDHVDRKRFLDKALPRDIHKAGVVTPTVIRKLVEAGQIERLAELALEAVERMKRMRKNTVHARPHSDLKGYLTVDEVALRFELTIERVEELCEAGYMPHIVYEGQQ